MGFIFLLASVNWLRIPTTFHWVGRFIVNMATGSLVIAALGFPAVMAVNATHSQIPGTATAGGRNGQDYYFNWKNKKNTPVPQQLWERTYLLELVAAAMLRAGGLLFAGTLTSIVVCIRWFPHVFGGQETKRE